MKAFVDPSTGSIVGRRKSIENNVKSMDKNIERREKRLVTKEQMLKEKFGKTPPKAEGWLYNKADGSTHRDEYTNEDGEFWAGFDAETWYISVSKSADKCKNGQMKVFDQRRDPIEANQGIIYSGCYVNLVIDAYAYGNDSGKGVSGTLEGIQLLRKGETLGITQINAEDEFEDEEIEAEDDEVADLL